jgi:Metallo-beta-lactamase superfamily
MKRLHRPDLFGWSRFDEARNIDFHSALWVRPSGNVAVDPLPLSEHDAAHLRELGGATLVVVTNSDHVRDAARFKEITGARLAGPRAEREHFPLACDVWLGEGDEPLPGFSVLELDGSKTPGELALLVDGTTLVTGDLVRAHAGGRLTLLPDKKLGDRSRALASLARLATLGVDAVLVGDGWPVFRDGARALAELQASLGA